FFFFSSRRRHTRSKRDWSSDVCSSDLGPLEPVVAPAGFGSSDEARELASNWRRLTRAATLVAIITSPALFVYFTRQDNWAWWERSEERRVGKGCRGGGGAASVGQGLED